MSKITYDQLITDIANGRNREESLRLVRLLVAEVNAWRAIEAYSPIQIEDATHEALIERQAACSAAVDEALTLPEGGE